MLKTCDSDSSSDGDSDSDNDNDNDSAVAFGGEQHTTQVKGAIGGRGERGVAIAIRGSVRFIHSYTDTNTDTNNKLPLSQLGFDS